MNAPRPTRNARFWLAMVALALGAAAAAVRTPEPKKPMALSRPGPLPARPGNGC